ncbi:Hypothetical predicted protein [Mytilus galloprovincialis]|uniref:C3H1-type domain-containing protein n=1 Tax=Mytilus galloprovincialis TaxID=29158 RepID=A0A8B6D9G3_MYTGA|nr:Hypothetical predicted protein [Mytilus galloprovincialis]
MTSERAYVRAEQQIRNILNIPEWYIFSNAEIRYVARELKNSEGNLTRFYWTLRMDCAAQCNGCLFCGEILELCNIHNRYSRQAGERERIQHGGENEQLPATSLQAQLNACATETIDGGAVQTGSGDIYVQAITKQLQQQQSLPLGDNLNKHQGQSTVHPEGTSEEKLISDASGGQLIFKSGPVKPKLESLSLCQWSSANLSIMYKLLSSGDLPQTQLLDYLSYTARIYNLVASCDMVSVFFYDREYRQLQKQHKFRWGTDVPHLHSIYLRPKGFVKPQTGGSKYQTTGPRPGVKHDISYASHTSGGREICKRFNSRKGCFMTNCRFEHVCAVPGCANKHPAHSHSNSLHGNPKNGV